MWANLLALDLYSDLVFVSDDAAQFKLLAFLHALCWVHMERHVAQLIPLTDALLVSHEECHRVADRDANGLTRLDANGAPSTHEDCHTISETLTVEVRVWPFTSLRIF